MKFVRFLVKDYYPKEPFLGAILDSKIIDLKSAYRLYLLEAGICNENASKRISDQMLTSNMVEFIENGELSLNAARCALDFAKNSTTNYPNEKLSYDYSEINLLAPITNPVNLRDFLSFEEHIKNARKRRGLEVPPLWYEIPAYYKGNTTTIFGHEDDILWPKYTENLDYELEFACIIGKNGIDISADDADDYIFGYTIMNDFSARDIQIKEMNIGLGPAKGKDFATALGPCIVTKDEIPNPYNLEMVARVNGEEWSRGNSGTMYRTFQQIIEHVSNSEPIVAGDVLGSGTVGLGCGLELGKQLSVNDVVELEISGLGILRNRIKKP
ncbi:MAG TPA: fumarylacetoacetate hydrolase family protein [Ureibacillus sp.]|nr:fumarylacetoacetate hydrolase family protein [Ureibacillus sp.]